MRGCFLPVLRPALPASSQEASKSSAAASSGPRTLAAAYLDDDVLYPSEAESESDTARLSNAIASRRFFFASPGDSNSIVDSAKHAAPPRPPARGGQPDDDDNALALRRVATGNKPKRAAPSRLRLPYEQIHPVQVTSGAPRADFLESMVEMADAMGLDPRRGAGDIAALQELLLCYIAVNEHVALRDIIGAYADLLCLFGDDNATAGGEGSSRRRRVAGRA